MFKQLFKSVGGLATRLANGVLFRGSLTRSTSARAFVETELGSDRWAVAQRVINTLFLPFEEDHCEKAWRQEVTRAKEVIELNERINQE